MNENLGYLKDCLSNHLYIHNHVVTNAHTHNHTTKPIRNRKRIK